MPESRKKLPPRRADAAERWRDKFTTHEIVILTPEELEKDLAERAARNGAPPPLNVADEPPNP